MLSPKRSQITAAVGTFGDEERGLWLPILVGSEVYRQTAAPFFADVSSKLAAIVADSLQAKQLNATMILIDKIGPVAAGAPQSEGYYQTQVNREGLIEYAFSVLYGAAYWTRFSMSAPRSHKVKNLAVLR